MAYSRVKNGLIISKIGNEKRIEVSDEEISAEIANFSQLHQIPREQLLQLYKSNKDLINKIKVRIWEAKIMKEILKEIITELKSVTITKLRQLYENS